MSAVIAPFQGTEPFNTTSFNNRISQINTGFSYVSNPNLLDNWYFANPVNQRGQTSYTPQWHGYSIDRWNVESDSELVITFVDGGIHVKNTSNSRCQFQQIIPSELNLAGRMITVSALVGDVIGSVNYMLSQTSDPYASSAVCTITTSGLFSASGSVLTGQQKISFVLEPGAEITILAAKLELGPTQTLAHQENGQWVLNEIPDYGEQLRRCQRYFYRTENAPLATGYAFSTTSALVDYVLPVQMRANPSIAVNGFVVWRFGSSVGISATTMANYGSDGHKIQLFVSNFSNTVTQNAPCDVYLSEGNSVDFIADL